MSKYLRICLLGLSLFTACSGGGDNDMATSSFDESLGIGENVDRFFAQTLSPAAPGAAVLIVKDGVSVHQKGYGLADIATGTPIETDSQFDLASVSKQFTALGVMILFERGFLAFDDLIRTYLPELSPRWEPLTIRHLLTHQAGIPDYLNDIFSAVVVLSMTNADVMAYFIDHPHLDFAPGTAFKYTNSGYIVLAELIARVSGVSFREFMHTHVFAPLGMTLTTVNDESRPDLPTFVMGYQGDGSASHFDLITAGDSGVVSTLDDLFLYQQALLAGQLVSHTTRDIAFSDQTHTGSGYGFGWGVGQYRGHPLSAHNGGLPGFSTRFVIVHDLDLTIIILANARSYERWITSFSNRIIDYYGN